MGRPFRIRASPLGDPVRMEGGMDTAVEKSAPIAGATRGQKAKLVVVASFLLLAVLLCLANPLIGGFAVGGALFAFTRIAGDNAPCPNCAKPLRILGKKLDCPDCKHRLVVRDGRLVDVT